MTLEPGQTPHPGLLSNAAPKASAPHTPTPPPHNPKYQQPKPTTFNTQLPSPTPQHSTTKSPHFPVLSPPHPQSWLEAKYNLCLKVEL